MSNESNPYELALIGGDLGKLTSEQRLSYYKSVCESLGLNYLTNPFAYIVLNGKTKLYALKDCTEQLRKLNGVSIQIAAREVVDGCYVVTARAVDKTGRADESIGAVTIANLKGENLSNAMMKAETKAKRRVTLSISGLGWADESEVDSIPGAAKFIEQAPQAALPPPHNGASDWERGIPNQAPRVAVTAQAPVPTEADPLQTARGRMSEMGWTKERFYSLCRDVFAKQYENCDAIAKGATPVQVEEFCDKVEILYGEWQAAKGGAA